MMITICEHVSDVANEIDAAHGQIVFTLDPADAARAHLGHAIVRVAAPVGRHEGVAVAVGDAAIDGVPDPVRILIRDESGPNPSASLVIRRKALPVLVKVESGDSRAWLLRRLAVRQSGWYPPSAAQGAADEAAVPPTLDAPPGTSDAVEE